MELEGIPTPTWVGMLVIHCLHVCNFQRTFFLIKDIILTIKTLLKESELLLSWFT